MISDKDSCVNVRKEGNIHSEVVKTLDNNTLIYVYEYDKPHDGNWLYADGEGFIYNDGVKWIEKLPIIAKGIENKNTVHFSGKDIKVVISKQKFNKRKHSFTYYKDADTFIEKIDGKPFWGTDGNMPREEYEDIKISINNKRVFFPKSAYEDLYEPTFYTEHNSVYYDKDSDTIYVVAANSDGAGAYIVCRRIEKGIYKERKIGIPF